MWWLLPVLLALASCAPDPPPPGELIGTFDFVATLQPSGACVLEDVEGLPDRIRFTGTLSHERETGRVWLRSGGSEREGSLDGNRFTFRVPELPPGIPREFATCTVARRTPCSLAFTEILEGRILADCEGTRALAGAEVGAPDVGGTEVACPEVQEDGSLRWHDCTCVEGRFVEEVAFDPPGDEDCLCAGRQQTRALEPGCELIYELQGAKT